MNAYKPRYIAFLGKAAYQGFFQKKDVIWGIQEHDIAGATVWVLPNPSGLNRSFSLAALVDAYEKFRHALVRKTTQHS
ncbi:uracil-DNA glycosylase family protein [Dyadobacter sp. CY261]|uniref:uracil-DNA glycosylase family protein n=1 Tax=Dyadobacter sp. CY261 TaxID=2907203 RepID=UPI0038D43F13